MIENNGVNQMAKAKLKISPKEELMTRLTKYVLENTGCPFDVKTIEHEYYLAEQEAERQFKEELYEDLEFTELFLSKRGY